jgi:hypothetical protein
MNINALFYYYAASSSLQLLKSVKATA